MTAECHPILLCYDRSAGSRRAIETAGALFPGHKAIVLYVWSPISVMVGGFGGVVPLPAFDDSELQAAARGLADEGTGLAIAAGLDASSHSTATTLDGTCHTILGVADSHDAALIVLGARGLSGFRSLVLGSVSHAVVQHAHRPVLVVPPPTHGEKSLISSEAMEPAVAG